MIARYKTSVEDFETFVERPENADKLFEYIGGEIVEVPSNAYSSHIASQVHFYLKAFVMQHRLGYVTGEAGGYQVAGERYAPDVAYISKAKTGPDGLARTGYHPQAPDLAVEVVSPTDDPKRLAIKVSHYLAAETLVLVVYPDTKEVFVHRAGQPVRVLTVEDAFEGGTLLPDFALPIADIFAALD